MGSTLVEIEAAVSKLSREDLSAFRQWFAAFDAEQWDRQLEQDSAAGRLDNVAKNAEAWREVNEFQQRLAATGRTFGDSTDDIREDRDR